MKLNWLIWVLSAKPMLYSHRGAQKISLFFLYPKKGGLLQQITASRYNGFFLWKH